ncbi:MAG: BNR-4 repeat-containing protein [Candidatus Eisenbacteria bacterium]
MTRSFDHHGRAALLLILACALAAASTVAHAVGVSIVSEDGAWSWFSDPRAFCDGEVVIAGWVTTRGSIQVGSHDVLDGNTTIAELEHEFGPDDHDYPAFFQTSDGRYTAFYSGHARYGTHNLYRTGRYTWDITEWNDRDSTHVNTSGSAGVTYSNPYAIPGETDEIYLFWRGADWKPAYASGTYDPVSREWSWVFRGKLITTSYGRPYVKYAQGDDKIGFAFTNGHPKETPSNIYYAAIAKDAEGYPSYYGADGTFIKRLTMGPLTLSEADTVFNRLADPTVTGDNSWIWDLTFDCGGDPVVAFASFPSRTHHQYHWARYDGWGWEDEILVADAGGSVADTTIGAPQYYYSGGLALDPVDPTITYVSVENGVGGWDIRRMRRLAPDTWDVEAITDGATVDNLRPVVPRGRPEDIEMVLWMSGTYDYYVNNIESEEPARDDTLYYDTAILCWADPAATDVPDGVVAAGVKLYPNQPNPFSGSTEIAYALGSGGRVSLRVYDASGRVVRAVVDDELPAGRHSAVWDGRDGRGHLVASGVYFVRLEADGRTETRRAVLVR